MSGPNLPVHVNLIWDPTLGMNFHSLWGPPPAFIPPPPGPFIPSFEMITIQMWTAGYLLGQNKFTTTVKHKSVFICVDDHDIGPLIPDITSVPVNIYYPIMWPFSSRKISFKSSTVKMNGKPTSCSQVFIPIPMMTCGDPLTLPSAYPIANLINTVTVGLSLADFLMGYLSIVVSVAIDAIFQWVPLPKFVREAGSRVAARLARTAGGRVLAAARRRAGDAVSAVSDRMGPRASQYAAAVLGKLGLDPATIPKKAVSALAGWGTSAIGGNPTLAYKVGGGLAPEVGVQAGGDSSGVHGGTVHGIPVGGTSGNTVW